MRKLIQKGTATRVSFIRQIKGRIWPDTFFQANPVQAEKLVELALEMADVHSNMRVLDLFCGVGTFSLPFAKRSRELVGIEIVENSILSARRNATENGLDNTYFMTNDARIGRFGTDKIIYISCSPKSLAEDLVWLKAFGYELVTVQPVDQFPHTSHVEAVTLLVKER